jgi:hypothetical protein
MDVYIPWSILTAPVKVMRPDKITNGGALFHHDALKLMWQACVVPVVYILSTGS